MWLSIVWPSGPSKIQIQNESSKVPRAILIDFIQPQWSLFTRRWWIQVIFNLSKIFKKNFLKMRLKSKTVLVTNPNGSNVRISNYIKIIDKENVVYILQEDYKSL